MVMVCVIVAGQVPLLLTVSVIVFVPEVEYITLGGFCADERAGVAPVPKSQYWSLSREVHEDADVPAISSPIFLMLKALSLKNGQIIIDLGAGDGVIIFETAYESMKQKLNTKPHTQQLMTGQ